MSEIINCRVVEIEPIVRDVYYVRLQPERKVNFKAGQYLNIIVCSDENDKRPFSIASTPIDEDCLELHIGAVPSNEYTYSVVSQLLTKNDVKVEAPLGDAWFREDGDNPLVLIAGGTGYSYLRAILTMAIALNPHRKIDIYWGGRYPENIYDISFLTLLSEKYPNITFHATVEHPNTDWQGEKGLLLDLVFKHADSFANKDIYIAGRFEMVKVAKEQLMKRNADESRIFSDVFSFL